MGHEHSSSYWSWQIASLLEQLAAMIDGLDDSQYTSQRAREVSGSIGGHVRHCLDHVSALVAGLECGRIRYDARLRGTMVESSRPAALDEIARLLVSLDAVPGTALERNVSVLVRTAPDGPELPVPSTVARELTFVASHTVHHFAIVALLLHDMGVAVPPRFGYAPSTPSPELAA
jgi:uncharacterized damage-inducible protein DinB